MWKTFAACDQFWKITDEIKVHHRLIIVHQLRHFNWALEGYPSDRVTPRLGPYVGCYGHQTNAKISEWMDTILFLRNARCKVETNPYHMLGMEESDDSGAIALRFLTLKRLSEYDLFFYGSSVKEEELILRQQKSNWDVPNFEPLLNATCDLAFVEDVMLLQRRALLQIYELRKNNTAGIAAAAAV